MPELVVPAEELRLRIWDVVFFVVDNGRCCGSVFITLQVKIGDNWELSVWPLGAVVQDAR